MRKLDKVAQTGYILRNDGSISLGVFAVLGLAFASLIFVGMSVNGCVDGLRWFAGAELARRTFVL